MMKLRTQLPDKKISKKPSKRGSVGRIHPFLLALIIVISGLLSL